MRTHDDRPGGAGGYFEDQQQPRAADPPAADRTQRVQPAGSPGTPGTAGATQRTAAPTRSGYYGDDPYGDDPYGDDPYGEDAYSDDHGRHRSSRRDAGHYDDGFDEDFFDGSHRDGRKRFGWNGGADLGLLVMRVVLGGVFVAHGAQKLFGVLGGPGPDGFAQYLQQKGFEQTTVLSWVTGVTELGGGVLLILGLFTPLAAAGVLGVMVNAVALKLGNGFFASSDGVEYEIVLGALAFGLLFTGPGRAAVDKGRSWFRHPVASGFIFLVVAAAASVSVFLVLR